MRFLAKFKIFIYIFIPFLAVLLMSQNTSASSYSSAIVDFYTNQQVTNTVNIPWSANPGNNKFWLNNVYVNDSSLHGSNITYIAGRVVSEFRNIGLVSSNTYSAADFCGYNTLTAPSVNAAANWHCRGSLTIVFTDTSNYVIDYINAIVNWDSVSKTGILYFDFNSPVDSSKTIDFIQFRFYAPLDGHDILSRVTDWYNVPLFTLFDVRSTVNGYETPPDVSDELLQQQIGQNDVIISQNDQIISNQNQNTEDIINNQNQNTEDIIKSNQNCHQSKNLINKMTTGSYTNSGVSWSFTDSTITGSGTGSSNWSLLSSYLSFSSPLAAGTYTFSIPQTFGNIFQINIKDTNGVTHDYSIAAGSKSVTFTSNYTGSSYRFAYRTNASAVSVSFANKFQLEAGSVASNYEPYGEEICKNINEEYYDEQRQADNNISNQSSSDIDGATNQQTTNLIGVLSNFFTQLQSFQATNCNLSLPFPQFIGGTQTVNICQGKDVLGNFITVIGTLAMVTFYIPLAWTLLKMIYNEIRSFTNG